ncbi:MAG: Bug family tripartite tricarboxylate transporter substrate binding protein, partial [Burkholderiaceae bacterium]
MMFKYARKMAFAAIAMVFSTATLATAYPDKPVRMIVPFPPGGSTDIMARVLSNTLQQQMGQPFVVQNRAGAGGVIGTDAAAKSDPDGYTILLSSSAPLAVGLDLYKNIPYNVLQDLVPVSMVGEVPMVLVTNPNFEAKTLPQLIGYARANPGKLTFALNALGSQSHVWTELVQVRTGTGINMIPDKGSSPAGA